MGIKYGISHFIDLSACAFTDVIAAAQTDQMAEIYSPGIITYFDNGEREFKEDYLTLYNDDLKLSCYLLISKTQALTLFPYYDDVLHRLPDNTLFFTDEQHTMLKIASQEKNERGINFSSPLPNFPVDDSFYLGALRSSFEFIASKLRQGEHDRFIGKDNPVKLDYADKSIRFTLGRTCKIKEAMEMVKENDREQLLQKFMKTDQNGDKNYHVLIDKSFLYDSPDNIEVCVAPEIYEMWGRPFTKEEIAQIKAHHVFEFVDVKDVENLNIKVNRLRFNLKTLIEMQKFSEQKCGVFYTREDILKKTQTVQNSCIQEMSEVIQQHNLEVEEQLKEERKQALFQEVARNVESTRKLAEQFQQLIKQSQQLIRENSFHFQQGCATMNSMIREIAAQQYTSRDSSGPSRSSMISGRYI